MKLNDYIKTTRETQTSLAEKLGVTQGLVSHWITGRAAIDAAWVIPIFGATNGAVTPNDVRPDIYPDPQWIPTEDQVAKVLAAA